MAGTGTPGITWQQVAREPGEYPGAEQRDAAFLAGRLEPVPHGDIGRVREREAGWGDQVLAGDRGGMIVISSMGGTQGAVNFSTYNAGKAAYFRRLRKPGRGPIAGGRPAA
jgi:hypothetical protein